MKNQSFLYAFLFIFSSIGFFSCGFLDEEYCKSNTQLIAYWIPPNSNTLGGDSWHDFVFFNFSDDDDPYAGHIIVDNVCPYGNLSIKISISEKMLIQRAPIEYGINIFEFIKVKGKEVAKKIKIKTLTRSNNLTGSVFTINQDIPLDGFLNEAPRKFAVSVYVLFNDPAYNALKNEQWPYDNISKVECKADYVRWK